MNSCIRKFTSTVLINFLLVGSSLAAGPTTTDSNGVIKSTSNEKFETKSDDNVINSLTTFTIGAVASRMAVSYRPVTPDVMVAAVGGVAYVAGEIVAVTKFKNASKEADAELTKSSDGKINEGQVEQINKLGKNYEDAKSAIKTKEKLQIASAVSFGLAAGIALASAFNEESMNQACSAAMAMAQGEFAACSAEGATGVGASEAAACGSCAAKVTTEAAEFQAYLAARKSLKSPTSTSSPEINATRTGLRTKFNLPCPGVQAQMINSAVNRTCDGAFSLHKMLEAVSPTGNKTTNKFNEIRNKIIANQNDIYKIDPFTKRSYFEQAIEFLNPIKEASAGTYGMMGFGVGATALAISLDKQLSTAIDIQMLVPVNRALIWTALAAGSAYSAKHSDKVADKMQENVDKINLMKADIKKMAYGIKTQNTTVSTLDLTEVIKNQYKDMTYSEDGTQKMPCLTSDSNENCKSIEGQFKNLPTYSELDPQIQQMGSQVAKFGDSLQGSTGLSGTIMSNANSINANANAIKKMNASLAGQISKLSGGSAYDPDKDGKKFSDELNSRVAKLVKENGVDPEKFLSSITGFDKPGSASIGLNDIGKANNPHDTSSQTKLASVDLKVKKATPTLNFKFKEDAAPEAIPEEKEQARNLADYEMDNDITKDNSISIFQIISNRYIRSGYPKLLEEETTPKN